MRIAVACARIPPDYGGAGLSAFKLAERHLRAGRLAFVLTRTRSEGNGRRVFADREGLPLVPEERIVRVAPEHAKGGGRLREAIPFLAATLGLAVSTIYHLVRRRREYDVIHCFTPSWLSFYAITVSRLLGKRAVIEATLIGRDEPQAAPTRDLLGMKSIARTIQYRLANRIVAISPALEDHFVAAGLGRKVHVVRRSVDLERFQPEADEERKRLCRVLRLDENVPILLFVGQIGERKGADILVPILARVVEHHPSATLVVVGQVGETAAQRALYSSMLTSIEEKNLGDRVRFFPRTGSIERFMKVAALFVFPSRREGFGTVVVEAMACGAVPVALRIPGITEHLISQGKDGLYLEDADPDAFAAEIIRILADPALMKRLASAGVQTARTRFGTQAIDSLYSTLYAGLGAGRPALAATHR